VFTSATVAAVFQPAIPVFACGLAILARQERLTWPKAGGLFLAVAGAVVVTVSTDAKEKNNVPDRRRDGGGGDDVGATKNQTALGTAILLAQTLGCACYIVLQKPMLSTHHFPTATLTTVSYGITAVLVALSSLYYPLAGDTDAGPRASSIWAFPGYLPYVALAYSAVFATFVNYLLIAWANKHSGATVVSMYMTLQPLATAVLSAVFLGEKITWGEGGGGALIVAGLLALGWAKRRERAENRAARAAGDPAYGVLEDVSAGSDTEGLGDDGEAGGGGGGGGGDLSLPPPVILTAKERAASTDSEGVMAALAPSADAAAAGEQYEGRQVPRRITTRYGALREEDAAKPPFSPFSPVIYYGR